MKRYFMIFCWVVFSFCISAAVGYGVYAMLAPIAYAERGYFAVGGEGMLGIFTSYILVWTMILNRSKIVRFAQRKAKAIKKMMKGV